MSAAATPLLLLLLLTTPRAATNTKHIVIAAEVNADSPDFGHLQPMVDATQRELRTIGINDAPSVLLADAGYWHQDHMENVRDPCPTA